MISSILIDNIEIFVNRIGVVYMDQISAMFGPYHSEDNIMWCIKQLSDDSRINYDAQEGILTRRQNVCVSDFGQKLLTEAAWLLSAMGEKQVREYWPTEYPTQLIIISEDDTVYDITVFTFQSISSLSMTVKAKRMQQIPDGAKDNIVHIAVVADIEMAQDIKELGFDSYCIIDDNNKPVYGQWED